MKAIKILLVALGSILALVFILSFFAPSDATVKRSIVVDVPQQEVFSSLRSFQFFEKWSPWQEIDPNVINTFEGVDGEIGSKMLWKGNEDVGEGSMEIVSIEGNKINILLKFTAPWESQSDVWFEAQPTENGQTEVTWGFYAEYAFPSNLFMMMMDMDEMLGGNYETGLGNLKALMEK